MKKKFIKIYMGIKGILEIKDEKATKFKSFKLTLYGRVTFRNNFLQTLIIIRTLIFN